MKKTLVIVLCIALLSVFAFAGCTAKSEPEAEAEDMAAEEVVAEEPEAEVYTIVIMPKLVGIPYFEACAQGAYEAGEDFGVNVIYDGPTEADATAQVKMLEDYISQGVDAICVAPNDPASMTPVLKKAKEKGIKVLDWDTTADPSVVDISVHQIEDKVFGEWIFETLPQNMDEPKGQYAIITGALEAANLNLWNDYGLAMMAEKYPDLELVADPIPSNEKQQEAYARTLELIKTYPDLKGIIGMSTPAPLGAAQAVQEKGLQDVITVVGSGTPNDSAAFLEDGSLDVSTLWDCPKLGYLTIWAAIQAIEGGELTDGMDVPGVGEIGVDGKVIYMGDPQDFTKENVGDFDF